MNSRGGSFSVVPELVLGVQRWYPARSFFLERSIKKRRQRFFFFGCAFRPPLGTRHSPCSFFLRCLLVWDTPQCVTVLCWVQNNGTRLIYNTCFVFKSETDSAGPRIWAVFFRGRGRASLARPHMLDCFDLPWFAHLISSLAFSLLPVLLVPAACTPELKKQLTYS